MIYLPSYNRFHASGIWVLLPLLESFHLICQYHTLGLQTNKSANGGQLPPLLLIKATLSTLLFKKGYFFKKVMSFLKKNTREVPS